MVRTSDDLPAPLAPMIANDLAPTNFQRNPREGLRFAVYQIEIFNFEQRGHDESNHRSRYTLPICESEPPSFVSQGERKEVASKQ